MERVLQSMATAMEEEEEEMEEEEEGTASRRTRRRWTMPCPLWATTHRPLTHTHTLTPPLLT